jgi:hypothetical protein
MGRKPIRREPEGEKMSMKKLTRNHEAFMQSRDSDQKVENEDGKEKFGNLIEKATKKQS